MTEPQVRIDDDRTTWVALDRGDLDPEDWAVTDATFRWQESGEQPGTLRMRSRGPSVVTAALQPAGAR